MVPSAMAQSVTGSGDVVPALPPSASSWNAAQINVGNSGSGSLKVEAGGQVSSTYGYIGWDSGSTGTVLVTGNGSSWTTSGEFVAGLSGTGTLTIEAGGKVSSARGGIGTYSGSNGSVIVAGAGSSWTNSGFLTVGNSGAGTLEIMQGGMVSASGQVYLGQYAGSAGTINIGAATGAPVAAGTLNAPTLQFGAGSATLNFNHTDTNYAFAAGLTSAGAGSHRINQIAGTTRLSGNGSTFTGLTTVSGGTLVVANRLGGTASVTGGRFQADGVFGGNVAASTGGVVTGSGTISGNLNVVNNGVLAGQQGQTLTIGGNLTLDGTSQVNVALGAASSTGLFDVAGNLRLDGTLNVSDQGNFGAGIYRLFDYGGTLTNNGLNIGTTPTGVSAGDLAIQTSVAGQVNLASTAGAILSFWDGGNTALHNNGLIDGGTGAWRADGRNWTQFDGSVNGPFQPNPTLAIFQGAAGTVTVDNSIGAIGVTGMQFASDGYRVEGDTISLQGASSTIRVGDGTLAGAGMTATIGSELTGNSALEKADHGTLVLIGANSYSGGTTIATGTLQLGDGGTSGSVIGNIANNGVLAFNRSDDVTLAGVISGTGTVSQVGSGTVTLTGANTYSGGTTIAGGRLLASSGGVLGSGAVGNAGVLQLDFVADGTLDNGLQGSGGLIKTGAGIATLTATGSSQGQVSVSGGTMAFVQTGVFTAADYTTQAGASTSIGASSQLAVTGTFTQSAGSTLNVAIGANNPAVTAGNAVLGGILNVSGYSGAQYSVIRTTGGITGDFASVSIGGSSSPVDYLTVAGGVSGNDYNVDLGLTWYGGTAQGNGDFTLAGASEVFDEGVALTNQTGPFTSGWDGQTLTKKGLGALTLSALNSYTGPTVIEGGTLAIASTGGITSDVTNNAAFENAGTVAGSVTNAAGATFTQAAGSVWGGVVNSGVVNANGGTLDGAVVNRAGGSFTVAGIVTSSGTFDNAADATLWVTGTGDYTLAGLLTNNGEITVAAGGALTAHGGIANTAGSVVTNNGTITGGLTQTAGTTINTGTVGGAVLISGGLFTGTGSAGALTVGSGGSVAPGTGGGIGTMTVNGAVTFNAGSTYQVAVNDAGQASRIDAGGSATLSGGTMEVLAGSGTYAPSTSYTILTANGGVTGGFTNVTSNLAFLDPTLTYDPSNVYLTMRRNDISFAGVGVTPNQRAAAGGAEKLGWNNPVHDAVVNLSAAQARNAFDQFSGEIQASARTAMIEDSRFLRDATTDRLRHALNGAGASTGVQGSQVMAYSAGGLDLAPADTDRYTVWGRGFGAWGNWNSDGNAARFDRSIGGLFMGADAPVFDNGRFGVIAGYSRTSFDAKDRNSAGTSDNYSLGLYGGAAWGDLAFRSGAAYTWHDLSFGRSVSFPGFSDSMKADYNAGTAQVFGELGYGINLGEARFEPYANLAYVNLSTDGYTERGGPAALTGDSATTAVTFATLGLNASTSFDLGGIKAMVRGTLGWRHAFGDVTPLSTLSFAGGSPFSIAGVPIARDSAVINAGLDLAIRPNATLGISYGGQFGSGLADQSVRANLAIKF